MSSSVLLIDREIEDVKAQVRQELAAINEILDALGYRNSAPGWDAPYQVHKLRRALRVHYLALKIRDGMQQQRSIGSDMSWRLE